MGKNFSLFFTWALFLAYRTVHFSTVTTVSNLNIELLNTSKSNLPGKNIQKLLLLAVLILKYFCFYFDFKIYLDIYTRYLYIGFNELCSRFTSMCDVSLFSLLVSVDSHLVYLSLLDAAQRSLTKTLPSIQYSEHSMTPNTCLSNAEHHFTVTQPPLGL